MRELRPTEILYTESFRKWRRTPDNPFYLHATGTIRIEEVGAYVVFLLKQRQVEVSP